MEWQSRRGIGLAAPLRIDRALLFAVLGAATVAASVLVTGSLLPTQACTLALDKSQVQRLVTLAFVHPADTAGEFLRSGRADRSVKLRGSAIGDSAGASGYGLMRRSAESRARVAGILGIVKSTDSMALSAHGLRFASMLGHDSDDALGGLEGSEIGDGFRAAAGGTVGIGGLGFRAIIGMEVDIRPRPARPALPAPVRPVEYPLAPMQSAIAAGEWDDNANYRDFQRWLAGQRYQPYVPIDVSHRRFLVVRDRDGRAVPRCTVAVRDDHGHATRLRTGPAGHALLFPRAEGLSGDGLTATASCPEGATTQRFDVKAQDGSVDLQLPTPRQLPAQRTIDVAFILDTTASMAEEIAAVKSTLRQVVTRLASERAQVRLALVEYKDRGDPFVTRVYPFSADAQRFSGELDSLSASGGGDTPEAVNQALHTAVTQLAWSADAVGRFAFLIGDAPPHLDYEQDPDYALAAQSAAHQGIQLFTVAASGMDRLGQIVWRQVAQYTGGVNLFVLRGGAGLESVGAGEPLAGCGGTHENFTSGNLDSLITSRVIRELRSLDGDPLQLRGLGQDERAAPCAKPGLASLVPSRHQGRRAEQAQPR